MPMTLHHLVCLLFVLVLVHVKMVNGDGTRIDCKQPNINFGAPGQTTTQLFVVDVSTFPTDGVCNFTLDGRGPYTLDWTLNATMINTNITVSELDVGSQITIYKNVPSISSSSISTRLGVVISAGSGDTAANGFAVNLTVRWFHYNVQATINVPLGSGAPWTIVDAALTGTLTNITIPQDDMLHLFVTNLDYGTAPNSDNNGLLIYLDGTMGTNVVRPNRLPTAPSQSFRDVILSDSTTNSYLVFIDQRYSASKIQLIFVLDSALGKNTTAALYRLSQGGNSLNIAGVSTALLFVDTPYYFAKIDSLTSTGTVTVLGGGPRQDRDSFTIFSAGSSDAPSWQGAQLRGRLLTFIGGNFAVNVSALSNQNDLNYNTNTTIHRKGVFMSAQFGVYGALALPPTFPPLKPDANGFYINESAQVEDDDNVQRQWTYEIVLADIGYNSDLIRVHSIGKKATDGSDELHHEPVSNGKPATDLGVGLAVEFKTNNSNSRGYLVRWSVEPKAAAQSAVSLLLLGTMLVWMTAALRHNVV